VRGRLVAADVALADPRRLITERQLRLESLARRAREAMRTLPALRRNRLGQVATRLGAQAPRPAAQAATIDGLAQRMLAAWQRRLVAARHEAAASAAQLQALSPLAVLGRGFALARLAAWQRRLVAARHEAAASAAQLQALSPLAVLGRGFALARREGGAVVRDAGEIAPGERLDVRFARGGARVEVLETQSDDVPGTPSIRRPGG